MSDNGTSVVSLRVDARERFFGPTGRDATRLRFGALLGLVLALHFAALGWLLHRDSETPAVVAEAVETPVEVVQEPPAPPPPPQPPPPKEAPSPPQDEKPATSAPRAGSKDPVEAKTSDAKTEAPRADAPPRDGQPEPAPAAAAAQQASTPEVQPVEASKRADDLADAEPLDKARPDPEKPDEPAAKVKTPTAATKPDPARQLAGLAPLPSYSFAAATPLSEFPAGTEDHRYLAVVYAKVMSKNRYRASAAARRGLSGVVSISFIVDYMGRVPYQAVSESSGHPDLDALAMTAVRTAAPFPSPPGSGSQQLVARMRFGPDP